MDDLSRAAGIESWLSPGYDTQFSLRPTCRKFRDVRESGRTVVFADSAAVKLVRFSPLTFSVEENWLSVGRTSDADEKETPWLYFRREPAGSIETR